MQRVPIATAQLIRERYVENKDLDWNDFFRFVAEKNRAYTLHQIMMSKIFYQLLDEYREYKRDMEKIERIKRLTSQEREGGMKTIADVFRKGVIKRAGDS